MRRFLSLLNILRWNCMSVQHFFFISHCMYENRIRIWRKSILKRQKVRRRHLLTMLMCSQSFWLCNDENLPHACNFNLSTTSCRTQNLDDVQWIFDKNKISFIINFSPIFRRCTTFKRDSVSSFHFGIIKRPPRSLFFFFFRQSSLPSRSSLGFLLSSPLPLHTYSHHHVCWFNTQHNALLSWIN